MPTQVTDTRSNANDQIAFAAKILGRSDSRRRVFSAIYHGRKSVKSAKELADATGLTRKIVLTAGKKFAKNGLVEQVKRDGDVAYKKDQFYDEHRKKVLSLSRDKAKLDQLPTKTNPLGRSTDVVRIPRQRNRARLITIDDIDSFRKIARLARSKGESTIPERRFKEGIKKILGEKGKFTDWGGERNDLFTSRLRMNGKRRFVAFAFKGPGKRIRKLTPAHLGKNGDQIQRLFQSSADVYLVQYWREIDESVLDQMRSWAVAKSFTEDREVFYGTIDGADTVRLITAYPLAFKV